MMPAGEWYSDEAAMRNCSVASVEPASVKIKGRKNERRSSMGRKAKKLLKWEAIVYDAGDYTITANQGEWNLEGGAIEKTITCLTLAEAQDRAEAHANYEIVKLDRQYKVDGIAEVKE